MNLNKRVDLLLRSSQRLMEGLKLPPSEQRWWFLRKEAWLHLKSSARVWWAIIRRKEE